TTAPPALFARGKPLGGVAGNVQRRGANREREVRAHRASSEWSWPATIIAGPAPSLASERNHGTEADLVEAENRPEEKSVRRPAVPGEVEPATAANDTGHGALFG